MNQPTREEQLIELSSLYGVDYVDLKSEGIAKEHIEYLVTTFLSVELCRLYQLLPLKRIQSNPPSLVIGMVNPNNLLGEDDISRIVRAKGLKWQKVVILGEDFQRYFPHQKSSPDNNFSDYYCNDKIEKLRNLLAVECFHPRGKLLIREGYVNKEQFKKALFEVRKTKKDLLKVLEEITQQPLSSDLLKKYKKYLGFELEILYGVPYFDRDLTEISLKTVKDLIDSLVSNVICHRYQLLPLQKIEGDSPMIWVGMVNPDNFEALDDLKRLLKPHGLGFKRVVMTPSDFDELFSESKKFKDDERFKKTEARHQQEVMDKLADVNNIVDNLSESISESDYSEDDLMFDGINQSPIIKLVNTIFIKALQKKVEEIYIQCQQDRILVQFRKDGQLKEYFTLPRQITTALVNRVKIMTDVNIGMNNMSKKAKIRRIFQGKIVDFIVSFIPSRYGENIYIQNLKNSEISFNLDNLIIYKSIVENLRKLINLPHGLIIISGGSKTRKTVTSYGMLSELIEKNLNIYTLEDIPQYTIPKVIQIYTRQQQQKNYASMLRDILEQNPDVIYINKLEDAETTKEVFSAVSNGKLILAEMDLYNMENVLFKFLEWDIKPSQIAMNLKAIINQRLVRKVCEQCRISYSPSRENLSLFKGFNWSNNSPKFYKALTAKEGNICVKCDNYGYNQMIIINEIMELNSWLQRFILKEANNLIDLRQEAMKEGMTTLLTNALKLVDKGLTTVEEVQTVLGDFIE